MGRLGLVLSGGGARGVAHLGLLQVLDEMGIKPAVISGVSSGAIIGALYAEGHAPHEILTIIKDHSTTTIIGAIFSGGGLFSPSGLNDVLSYAIPNDSFEHLQIPLLVTRTDIVTGTSVIFSNGPLHKILISSSTIRLYLTRLKAANGIWLMGV